jgi:hypothetical protein
METKVDKLAKKILTEKKKVFSLKKTNTASLDRFLYIIEKCEGKKNGNNGSK